MKNPLSCIPNETDIWLRDLMWAVKHSNSWRQKQNKWWQKKPEWSQEQSKKKKKIQKLLIPNKRGLLFCVFSVTSLSISRSPLVSDKSVKVWSEQISGCLTEQSKTGQECRKVFCPQQICHALVYLQRKSELKIQLHAGKGTDINWCHTVDGFVDILY